jgi:hypothetical protein
MATKPTKTYLRNTFLKPKEDTIALNKGKSLCKVEVVSDHPLASFVGLEHISPPTLRHLHLFPSHKKAEHKLRPK